MSLLYPKRVSVCLLLAAALSCEAPGSPVDVSSDSGASEARLAKSSSGNACASDPDFVVGDRDALLSALSSAAPGQAIAVDGMIEIDFDVNVETPNLTFDCATPGSGLSAAPGVGAWLFIVKAHGTVVQNLVLDARGGYGAYLSDKNDADAYPGGLAIRGNTALCDSGECVFVQTAVADLGEGAWITDNTVELWGGSTGIHVQGWDGATVSGNRVVAMDGGFSAIVINGSAHVRVADNLVEGSWVRAVHFLDGVSASEITGNTLPGATIHAVNLVDVLSVAVTDNTVTCGSSSCMFTIRGTEVAVEGNAFTSQGSLTGLHFQGNGDAARVRRNRIIASQPSTNANFGAIRIVTGSAHLIADNEIVGPWANGVSLRAIGPSEILKNSIRGSTLHGVLVQEVNGLAVENNRVGGAGEAGVLLTAGCYNRFRGNNLQGNPGNRGLVLEAETGANAYVGNKNVVVDDGAFDCDGDGLIDPNVITGA